MHIVKWSTFIFPVKSLRQRIFLWFKPSLWAILATTLVCFPAFLIFILSDGLSPSIFNDWDEPLYLLILKQIGSYPLSDLVQKFPETPSDFPFLPRLYAHSLVDLVLGKLYHLIKISGSLYLLTLDWCCTVFAFLAYSKFYAKFSKSFLLPELAASVAVLFPYLIGSGLDLLPIKLLDLGPEPAINFYPSIPSMRSVYTQMSIPLFIIGLSYFLDAISPSIQSRSRWKFFVIGCYCGCLVYVYGFAWISLSCLATSIGLVALIFRYTSLSHLFKTALPFILGVIVLGFPGVLLSSGMRDAMGMHKGVGAPFTAWVPVGYLLSIGVLFYLLKKARPNNGPLLNIVFVACLLTEFTLCNLDFLTNTIWTSYHFSLFYLRPVSIGLLVIAVRSWLEKNPNSASNKSSLVAVCLIATSVQVWSSYLNFQARKGEEEAVRYFANYPTESFSLGIPIVSTETDEIPLMNLLPLWIGVLDSKDVFYGESKFEELFGKSEYGFSLLRTALITGGFPKNFCKRISSFDLRSLSTPLFRWVVVDFQKQCSRLPHQLDILCQDTSWQQWYPNYILVNEFHYRNSLIYRKASSLIASFPTEPKLNFLTVLPDEEKQQICLNFNNSAF